MAFDCRLRFSEVSSLTERKHALILVTTRLQRCAGRILLSRNLAGSTFGCGVIVVLPVFCGARRAPSVARDRWLWASLAFTEFFFPLALLFLAVAGGLLTLWPLISLLVVFSAFLQAALKFEWGWGGAWFLASVWFFDSGFRFWVLRLPCRLARQRNGALENNSFGIL